MHDLIQERQGLQRELNASIADHREWGRKKAYAEYDYRVALAKKLALLRVDGQPVTIVNDLARGDEEIAMLRLKRDLAISSYDSAQEAINNYKLQLRIIDGQIAREWNSNDR